MSARTRREALLAAALWSVAGHLFLFGTVVWRSRDLPWRAPGPAVRATVELEVRGAPEHPPSEPERPWGPVAEPTPGPPPPTIPGPADVFHDDMASPNPRADVDTPDRRAAAHGGGDTGGTPSWTGRNDGDEELRAQGWNDPDTYRLPRHADADWRSSLESIARERDPALDNAHRDRRRLARVEDRQPEPRPDRGAPTTPDDLDPTPGGLAVPAPGPTAPPLDARPNQEGQTGAVVAGAARPTVKEGANATEADERGLRADDVDAAQASNEKHPVPLELTKPSAGGHGGTGVAGPTPGAGNSARSPRKGDGQGGTPEDLAQKRAGEAAMRARAQDAYFKTVQKRIVDNTDFPRELALDLEQGEVVVAFTLRQDGTVAEVSIDRPSGHAAFDKAVIVAVKRSAPFPRMPAQVSGGAKSIRVKTPIVFFNPVMRP